MLKGTPFVVMERLPGETVAQVLAEYREIAAFDGKARAATAVALEDADIFLVVGDDHPPHPGVARRDDAPEADVPESEVETAKQPQVA